MGISCVGQSLKFIGFKVNKNFGTYFSTLACITYVIMRVNPQWVSILLSNNLNFPYPLRKMCGTTRNRVFLWYSCCQLWTIVITCIVLEAVETPLIFGRRYFTSCNKDFYLKNYNLVRGIISCALLPPIKLYYVNIYGFIKYWSVKYSSLPEPLFYHPIPSPT